MTGTFLDELPADVRQLAKESELPERVDPMLATLTDERFSDPDWIFERKLDGERCLARVSGGRARVQSRSGRDNSASYPDVVESLEEVVHTDALVDGEMVAFRGDRTSFQRLQPRIQVTDPDAARRSGVTVYYYVFDVMHAAGFDLRDVPLRSRKALLKRLVDYEDPVRFTAHRNEEGEAYFHDACGRGWEGLIAKNATSEYAAGRSRSWLKFKCVEGQELVIGGFTEPEGSRVAIGALLVGYHTDRGLVYAGKVGTGFDEETLRDLESRLSDLSRDGSPFVDGPRGDGVTFVEPRLVAEIGFTEWTDAGRLRHPRYLGLRRDKDPRDVVREEPSG